MKNKLKNKSEIMEITIQSKPEGDESELRLEQDSNIKINVKLFHEPTRPYFSSPCMLSEIEDNQYILDRYF